MIQSAFKLPDSFSYYILVLLVVVPESLPLPTTWSGMSASADIEAVILSPSDSEYQDAEMQARMSAKSVPQIIGVCIYYFMANIISMVES